MLSPVPTILAIASPPGPSLRGIVRISGRDAFALLDPHLVDRADPRAAGEAPAIRGVRPAALALPPLPPFSVLALRFPAPHSYTGENALELQTPGNPALLERIVESLLASGAARGIEARRAEAGEFTARAFFSGRLDLTQAEGVAATIAAQSDAELAGAGLLMSGRLGDFAHALADDLAAALALVEAGIDFTDQDDVVAIAPEALRARLASLHERLAQQLDRSVAVERLQAIPWVALAGAPNTGKSALFNALLGRERAVVSNRAGTTRDVLAEPLSIAADHGRAEVMLVDLAGLDEGDASSMNALMQAAARAALQRAELILRCIPIEIVVAPSPMQPSTAACEEIVIRTKCDLAAAPQDGTDIAAGALAVSARTGAGLAGLRAAIADRLAGRAVSLAAGALALQPRHESAMRSALAGIEGAQALVVPQQAQPALSHAELIASAMRSALDDLASLVGDLTPDDILGRIFASFCIGK